MRPVPLSRRVVRTIERRALFTPGERVIVALSGGADSVGLTWLLNEIAPAASWQLVGLVHVHHGLRGDDADRDETFCRDLAHRTGLPIEVARVDVAARARAKRQSIEAAARDERYAAFASAAERIGATAVATAHTQDDQAETVLLRLFRGAGIRGLSAIRPRRDLYARPLLDVSRREVRGYLEERGEPFREDASNLDQRIARNRLRLHLLPLIVADWPGAVRALARFAELAADDERFLAGMAAEVAPAVTFSRPAGVELDVRGLSELPPALARRVLREVLERTGGRVSLADIEAIRRLAASKRPRGRLDLSAVAVEKRENALRFERPLGVGRVEPFEYGLPVPGEVRIHETDLTVKASFHTGAGSPSRGRDDRREAVLQADRVILPLTVRNRRPGDRFYPLGAPGWRKLQDVLVDRKVPRTERDRVPLVVDATGQIVWVGGVEIAEPCRVTSAETGVVVLNLTQQKG